jgi:hypothetical protein
MDILLYAALAVAAVLGAAAVYVARSRPSPTAAARHRGAASLTDDGSDPAAKPLHWPSLGRYAVSLVGEARFQDAISAEVRELHGVRGSSIDCTAELVVESHNRQEPGAVSVRVKNRVVGYLGRDSAVIFRRRLAQHGRTGQTTTCGARIVGGTLTRTSERTPYSVRLDLTPFE